MKIKDFNAETQRTQSPAEVNFSLRPSASPRLCVEKPSRPHTSRFTFHVSRFTPHSQRGVALIITLILLGVVTFMAVAFLALSRRERGAVTTVTDTASARLAADAALANAEAQVMANVLSTTNPYNFGLLVSTNYINAYGFQSGFANPTNVNYDYYHIGGALSENDYLKNLANLYYSPRPPVFIPNPTDPSLPLDFRYYLDLNRNGMYDRSGPILEINSLGVGTGNTVTNVGDPEWIGVLQRPDQPYGPNNPFVARYAFIALPVGNTLDLNYIYNQAGLPNAGALSQNPVVNHYLRNQGVGSWELNLAAFFYDLNTNIYAWGGGGSYFYDPLVTGNVNGNDFLDALDLYRFRLNGLRTGNPTIDYAYDKAVLNNVDDLFGATGDNAFGTDFIDGYSDGPLQTAMSLPADNDASDVNYPWPGADNVNHFFSMQELFNPNESSIVFTNRLQSAGTNVSTYDRYTFYRLLSQLGTDSTPDSGRMNLNYDNLTTNGPPDGTNLVAWQPLAFFTNAADRLLRSYTTEWRNSNPTNFATTFYAVTNFDFIESRWTTNYLAFGITNIPVLVSNQFVYSSAVNRLLQLAANMYDATTNNAFALGMNYPSVFRPTFWVTNEYGYTNVYINGYQQVVSVVGTNDFQLSLPLDVTLLHPGLAYPSGVNVYGVPWIIGAKKGFPNFNEFSLENSFQITRKLQYTRNTNSTPWQYASNQMYIMSITNFFGVECWNSYSNAYPRQVTIMARIKMAMNLTSDATGYSWPPPSTPNSFITTTITTINPWPAYNNNMGLSSFVLPFGTNALVLWLPDSVYNYGPNTAAGFTPPGFIADSNNPPNYLNLGTPPLSHFGLLTTNRLQVVMLDGNNVIDYVQLNGMDSSRDLNAEIADPDDYGLWSTSLTNGAPQGVINQYYTSSRGGTVPKEDSDDGFQWNPVPGLPATKDAEQYYFSLFMTPNGTTGTYFDPNTRRTYSVVITATNVQVPYTPTRTRVQRLTWQANDPLVHYLASDLTDTADDTNAQHVIDWPYNLGFLNTRYMPWSGNPVTPINPSAPDFNTVNAWNLAVKDPLVSSSDNWDFPTYKFPTVGWLGRVHRGTPWQTVYLKASPTDTTNWMTWTGNENLFDATNAAPGQDRLLFDLFTTAFNDNATRGTLSVNQGAGSSDPAAGLAAWSAVFSGVLVLSNNASDAALTTFPPPMTPPFTAFPIDPAGSAGLASAVGQLVQGINQTRANNNLQSFTHMGDILSVPQLTEQSPFLNWKNDIVQQQNGISDEMYEWLPQQVMSLMRASSSPRYVIYCYGQALKPAPESVYNSSGAYFGMITNYQVVSEIATRAVVRFDSMVTNVITYSVIFTNSVEFPGGFYVTNWYTVPVMKNNNAVIESFNLLPPD